jgi:hypothetical protein
MSKLERLRVIEFPLRQGQLHILTWYNTVTQKVQRFKSRQHNRYTTD